MSGLTIGIIGGTGSMGRWFERFFTETGNTVLISGRQTLLSPEQLAEKSEVVILSVPIGVAVSLCKKIGPLMSRDQLLMDFCSMKEVILKAMLCHCSAQVIGTHPLFGPFTRSLHGQNVIVCPGRGKHWLEWLEGHLRERGAVVTRMDPVAHDRNMAVIQGLTHLLTICMGRTLQKMNMALDVTISCSTPVFRINADLIGRLFAQDLNLYADLIAENGYVGEAVEIFLSALEEGRRSLLSGQKENAAAFLHDIRRFLGNFCQEGLKESNTMIDSIYSDLPQSNSRDTGLI
jgi:prephenate dehydrogenase